MCLFFQGFNLASFFICKDNSFCPQTQNVAMFINFFGNFGNSRSNWHVFFIKVSFFSLKITVMSVKDRKPTSDCVA